MGTELCMEISTGERGERERGKVRQNVGQEHILYSAQTHISTTLLKLHNVPGL